MPTPRITDQAKQEAISWVLRLRSEKCSPEDKRQFMLWLAKDASHQTLYDRFNSQWQALDRFQGATFSVRSDALAYRPTVHWRSRQWTSLAMAASLLLVIGFTALSPNGWYGTHISYVTAHASRQIIALNEGSTLELNGDTEIRVHLNRWHRSVELVKGEAFFSVAHDSTRPFAVTAANGTITDIGTQFEVYLQPDQVLVAVQEGRVRVDTDASRELTADQLLTYNRNGEFLTVNADNLNTLTAWRRGQLVFNNRRLDEVLTELSRYYDKHIQLASPSLGKLKVSGRFYIDRLDSALDSIASTLSVSIQRPNTHDVILKKP